MKFKKLVFIISVFAVFLYFLGFLFPIHLEKEPLSDNFGFTELFFYNLKTEVFSILLGCITLGVYSITYLFLNFFSMGSISSSLMKESSIIDVLSMFVVHGVFEIPAMILTVAFGIYIPWRIIIMLKNKEKYILPLKYMIKIFNLILILTILAATIEVFITPKLI
ncbi:hypothetical protein ASE51_26380 [Bacillus sp. Root147]|nr:hypothetical protein ASE51_26380 [Bacillus sp. Root147]